MYCEERNKTNFDNERLIELLKAFDDIAKTHYDGRYTIYAFRTNYRVMFGTSDSCDYINGAYEGSTLLNALENCLRNTIINNFPEPKAITNQEKYGFSNSEEAIKFLEDMAKYSETLEKYTKNNLNHLRLDKD